MSIETNQPSVAPPQTNTSGGATASPHPPPNTTTGTGNAAAPDELKVKLADARAEGRREQLKRFGVDKESDLEARLAKLKALEQEKLSSEEKLTSRIKELEPAETRAKGLEQRLTVVVERELRNIPEAARAEILKRAGDDLEKRLDLLDFYRASQPVAAPPPAGDAGAPPAPAANTAAGAPPPRPGAAPTPWEKYEDIRRSNPVLADIFFTANRPAIEASRPGPGAN